MELSLRIKENTMDDTLGTALGVYAAVEKLLYQNKTDEALTKIEALKLGKPVNKLDTTKALVNYTILDDVYWLEAKIRMKRGEFNESIALLEKILKEYPEDVLADDAYFTQGDIYQHQLQNKEKAMEIYREFLNKFPGSVFAAEARKRFRVLRGDFGGEKVNVN
jgi:outer membrane protein assembly factor BamD (BamD/ComL family)